MLKICDQCAINFDLKFTSSKSLAMTIDKSIACSVPLLFSVEGSSSFKFVNELKYLGVCVMAARCFKTSISHIKIKFYRTFNCIYSRSKADNSEIVTIELVKAYCLPLLLYASKSCFTHYYSVT